MAERQGRLAPLAEGTEEQLPQELVIFAARLDAAQGAYDSIVSLLDHLEPERRENGSVLRLYERARHALGVVTFEGIQAGYLPKEGGKE